MAKCDVAFLRAMRGPRVLLIAAAMAFVAACGKDTATSPTTGTGSQTIVYTLTVDTTLADTATATVATQVPVVVHLSKAGVAVPNGTVTWKATLGSGKVTSETSTTDANGNASILWTLGDTAGFNTLSISSFDATAAYHGIGTADEPSNLIRVSSDSSTVVSGASLADCRARDGPTRQRIGRCRRHVVGDRRSDHVHDHACRCEWWRDNGVHHDSTWDLHGHSDAAGPRIAVVHESSRSSSLRASAESRT